MKRLVQKIASKCCFMLVAIGISGCGQSPPAQAEIGREIFADDFSNPQKLEEYTTNNKRALKTVSFEQGRYKALVEDNFNNQTLHFNKDQGRLDAVKVKFPFVAVVRNIGIEQVNNPQVSPVVNKESFLFAGLQVHVLDLDQPTSTHVVVGHRGHHQNTVEGKNTINGQSWVNDVGPNTAPSGRADLMIVGEKDRTLKVFWQVPNLEYPEKPDNWNAYGANARLPGNAPAYEESVYIGLITYAYGEHGLPFVGTADAFNIYEKNDD